MPEFEPGPFRLIEDDEIPEPVSEHRFEQLALGMAGELAGSQEAIAAHARTMGSDLERAPIAGLEEPIRDAARELEIQLRDPGPSFDTDAAAIDGLDVTLAALEHELGPGTVSHQDPDRPLLSTGGWREDETGGGGDQGGGGGGGGGGGDQGGGGGGGGGGDQGGGDQGGGEPEPPVPPAPIGAPPLGDDQPPLF